MIIYTQEARFDSRTGKPTQPIRIKKELRCDFTGQIISMDDNALYCSYALDYGDSDPCFGSSGREFELMDKHKIDVYSFLQEQYTFIQNFDSDYFAEQEMMEKFKGMSFHDMCREARIETAFKLIEEGSITSDQLGSELYE